MTQELHERYDTPTIALQIMPEEFLKFCQNLKHYLSLDITEYEDFSEKHKEQTLRMFGCMVDFPCGLCGDIVIYFQHEDSFQTAVEKWNRRKVRVHYDNLVYLFVLDYDRYQKEAQEFSEAQIRNSYIFTNDFDIEGEHYRYTLPPNPMKPDTKLCFLDKNRPKHYVFEGEFRREVLWKSF